VTWNRLGKGNAIVFGTLVGTSCAFGDSPESAIRWVTWPVELAGVRPPVKGDRLKIETPVLRSPQGAAVTLLNWTGKEAKNLRLAITVERPVQRVVSVQLGEQKFETDGGKIILTLPSLVSADVLKVYHLSREP
jgi:hypothetical protein